MVFETIALQASSIVSMSVRFSFIFARLCS